MVIYNIKLNITFDLNIIKAEILRIIYENVMFPRRIHH